jgi:type II secretory pathway component PulM
MTRPFHLDLRAVLDRLPRLPRPAWFDRAMVSAVLARLSPRERHLVGAAGVVLGGVLFYGLVVDPLWELHDRLQARVAAKERELKEVIALRQTYRALRKEDDRTRLRSDTNVSPFAFLESLATGTVGREKVAAINPAGRETRNGVNQETIEVRLKGVSLRELVELLHKIESAGMSLRTVQLSIKKTYKDPYSFDVSLTNVALSPR